MMAEKEPILIADDEPQMLGMLSEVMRGQGYAVHPVANGLEALEALQEQKFHLALLDIGLPGLSGLELLSRIKAESPQTEVIVFTGHAGLDSAVQALRLGAYDYLLKSEIRLENLQTVVARALERRRLALSNRKLMTDLHQVQQELSQQHTQDLSRVRRLSEARRRKLDNSEAQSFQDLLLCGSLRLVGDELHAGLAGSSQISV